MKYGIIIKNSKIPELLSIFISINAITLWPFIIFKGEVNDEVVRHERIHIMQQRELLVIFFYLLYVVFWIFNLVKYRNSYLAYANLPFEREAYANDHDEFYILNRKTFAWLNYIV